jgi:hypothetical protein
MKNFIAGFLVGSLFFGGVAMAFDRESFYQKFGPQMIEAVVQVMWQIDKLHCQKINQIITATGISVTPISDYTLVQYGDVIQENLDNTPIYAWMADGD